MPSVPNIHKVLTATGDGEGIQKKCAKKMILSSLAPRTLKHHTIL
jgi:hypothetical protein